MKISSREAILGISAAIVLLYGASIILAKPKIEERTEAVEKQAKIEADIEEYNDLISKRGVWDKKFKELHKLLPEQPADKKMDVYWMQVMDQLASKHSVTISKRQGHPEEREGEVYELPVECKDWEGDLDSIVNFLFELQSEGAMLDIRQLVMKPKENGALRGSFTLFFAYTRAKQASGAPKPE